MARNQESERVSLLAVDQYVREVRHLLQERLSPEEEERLFALVIQGIDERRKLLPDQQRIQQGLHARDQLVLSLQFLVMHIAGAFLPSFRHVEWLDLVQEGNEAVLRMLATDHLHAVTSWRKLAAWYVRKAMIRALYSQESLIRVREDLCTLVGQIHRVQEQLTSSLGHAPELADVAESMQLPEEHVRQVLHWRECATRVESLHVLWEREGEDAGGDERRLHLVGVDEPMPGCVRDEPVTLREPLRVALARLAPRKRELLCRRYGLQGMGEGQASPVEVADAMGIEERSMGRLESIAKKALAEQLRVRVVNGRAQYELQVPEADQDSYYTLWEVSEKVGCHPHTVYRLVQEGKLMGVVPAGSRAMRVFPRTEVEALVAVRSAGRCGADSSA